MSIAKEISPQALARKAKVELATRVAAWYSQQFHAGLFLGGSRASALPKRCSVVVVLASGMRSEMTTIAAAGAAYLEHWQLTNPKVPKPTLVLVGDHQALAAMELQVPTPVIVEWVQVEPSQCQTVAPEFHVVNQLQTLEHITLESGWEALTIMAPDYRFPEVRLAAREHLRLARRGGVTVVPVPWILDPGRVEDGEELSLLTAALKRCVQGVAGGLYARPQDLVGG